jgi:hypothetical protein
VHDDPSHGRHSHGHHHHDADADYEHTHHPHVHEPGPGHNRPKASTQWQVLHYAEDADPTPPEQRDLDLIESSFVEGFGRAPDPTSFLRLACIPFVGVDATGRSLHLLRVEIEGLTDIGAVSPLLGGTGVRYDPLPARLVSQRRRLVFAYHDGRGIVRLRFAEARALRDASGPTQFAITPST